MVLVRKSDTRLAAVVLALQPDSVKDTPSVEKFRISLAGVALVMLVTVNVWARLVVVSVSVRAPVVVQPVKVNEWLALALVTFRFDSTAVELAPTCPCRTPEPVETVV